MTWAAPTANAARSGAESATTWTIDADRSSADFTIAKRQMLIQRLTVHGRFTAVTGTIVLRDDDPTESSVRLAIPTGTIDTGNARRDQHLHKAEFFDVERYPRMVFISERVEAVDRARGRYRAFGTLTVRTVSVPVSVDVSYAAHGPGGDPRMRITGTTKIMREDFGISWKIPLLAILGKEVDVTVTLEATPASPQPPDDPTGHSGLGEQRAGMPGAGGTKDTAPVPAVDAAATTLG